METNRPLIIGKSKIKILVIFVLLVIGILVVSLFLFGQISNSSQSILPFPEKLLSELGIKDGERVDVKVKKGSLVFIKETGEFFALEGSLKGVDIETPIRELEKDWKNWNGLKSL